jgi:hypothetical protein
VAIVLQDDWCSKSTTQGEKTMADHHPKAEKELVQEEVLLDDPVS